VVKIPERWPQFIERSAGGNRFSPLLRLGSLTVLLFALLGAVALTWHQMRSASQGYPGTPHALSPALDVRLGINDDSGSEHHLARIEEAGLEWLRLEFPWAEIEPQFGSFEWSRWDAIVERISERNLRLVAVLDSTPGWAQSDPTHPHPAAPPHEVADFGRFARAFAHRYGDVIDHYQIWDEPNLSQHWGGAYVDPAAYVRLLREAYIQIRNVDPSAVIVLAGLAPTVESGPLNLNEVAFLEGVYAAGGADCFDIAAAKPYGFWHRANDPQADVNVLNFGRVELLRQVMEAHGDVQTPLWAVGFGWNALPADWQGRPSAWGTDTEALQAADTVAAIERARREWPWLGLIFLPPLRPNVPDDDPFVGFALLDEKGQPRPVYSAVRDLLAEPPIAWPGRYRPDHASARYTGDWRVTADGADIPAGAAGNIGETSFTIPFHGTRLDLTLRRGSFWGVLTVTVDGQPANRLPRDEKGRAYLVLYDPLQETATVPLAAGLPDGPHEAVIIPEGGWGQWAIAGWTVGREPDLLAYRIALISLAVASVLCLIVTTHYFFRACLSLSIVVHTLDASYASLPEGLQLALLALGAAAFYFAPGLLLSLIAFVVLALLIFLRPDHGLALVAFGIPFFLRPKQLVGKAFSLVEIGTWLCFAAWVARGILDAKFSFRNLRVAIRNLRSADVAIVALVALAALSLVWADNFGVAAREFRVVVFEAAMFYLLLRAMADRGGGSLYRRVVDVLVAGAVGVSCLGLWQYFVSGDVITAEGVRRVRALYGSPNNLALFLDRVLPLVVAVALWSANRKRRVVYAVAALPVLAALFLTFSKGALFLALPAGFIFLGLMRGRRAVGLALAALIILGLALLPFAGTERFASTFDLAGGTAFFRLKLWRSSVNMIAEQPLTGVGLDNFLYAYRTRYVLPEASDELNLSHPHNALLDFWTRLGLGGVIVLLWLGITFFRAGLARYRRLPDGDKRALVLGLLASMVAALAHGLIDQVFFLVDLAYVFVLALAAVQSFEAIETADV
jgi:O-antigen ligase